MLLREEHNYLMHDFILTLVFIHQPCSILISHTNEMKSLVQKLPNFFPEMFFHIYFWCFEGNCGKHHHPSKFYRNPCQIGLIVLSVDKS